MKALIWVVFFVLAGLWTGLVALTANVTEWLLGAMASGQVSDVASAAGQWPIPQWLALWVDPVWLQGLQLAWVDLVQWLGQVLPAADSLTGWITPVMWTAWLLVTLTLLALAVIGHLLVGKFSKPAAAGHA